MSIQKIKLFFLSIAYYVQAIRHVWQKSPSSKAEMDSLTIVCASDNNYVPLLATMIKSLEETYKGSQPLQIYILSNGITASNKAKLVETFSSKIAIEYIEVDAEKLVNLGFDQTFYGLSVHFYRLLIPFLLPKHIHKAIYLDCDLIINRDITELWNVNLEGNVVAAALDTRCESFYYGIKNYQELGLEPDTRYFNSGVMLIDLVKWKEEDVTGKTIACSLKNKPFIRFWDQYALNIVLMGRWKRLNQNWNLYTEFWPSLPFIIHFAGAKPTAPEYSGGYKRLFHSYLNQTAWK